MGRPITINLNEIDVEELCDADFYERQDDHPLSISHRSRGDMLLDFRKHSDSHVFYAVKTARQATLREYPRSTITYSIWYGTKYMTDMCKWYSGPSACGQSREDHR